MRLKPISLKSSYKKTLEDKKHKKKKRNAKRKKIERLSEYDIRELMGINKDIYYRSSGRVKRK